MPFEPDQPTTRGGFIADYTPEGRIGEETHPPYPPLLKSAFQVLRSTAFGGPIGGVSAAIGEGGKALDRAAYDVGGKVTDVTGSPAAGYAANVATQAVPAVITGGPAKTAAPALEGGAKWLMQSALKPDALARQSGDAAKAIQTMLDEGITLSQAGAAKMRSLVEKLHGEIAKRIAGAGQASTEAGLPAAKVDKGYVGSELYQALQKFRNQVNPTADVKKVLESWDEFLRVYGTKPFAVEEAQKLKQGTYKILAEKYAKGGTPAVENEASTQAQMAMARGLRKGIEDAVPGVGELNARESAIINALELAEKRSGVAGNRDIAGIAWLANHPAAAAAMLADRSPAFKSLLARLLYSGREQIPATAARAGAGTYAAEQGSSQ